jgi:hypothetical protein
VIRNSNFFEGLITNLPKVHIVGDVPKRQS